jgi:hypothetical protein
MEFSLVLFLPECVHRALGFDLCLVCAPGLSRVALHCSWNVIATQPLGLALFQAHGILPRFEDQSRTRGSQSDGVEDQPQCRGLWHSIIIISPSGRFLSRSPSPPPPSFTQSPSPPRSLVRDGQTSPHRSRLVCVSSLVAHVLHYPPPTRTALY